MEHIFIFCQQNILGSFLLLFSCYPQKRSLKTFPRSSIRRPYPGRALLCPVIVQPAQNNFRSTWERVCVGWRVGRRRRRFVGPRTKVAATGVLLWGGERTRAGGRGTAAAKVSSVPAPRNALFTRPPTSAPDPVKLKALYLPERRRRRTIPRVQKRVDGARIKSTTCPLTGPGRTGRGEKMAYFHAGLYARRQCMSPPPLPPSPCSSPAKGKKSVRVESHVFASPLRLLPVPRETF